MSELVAFLTARLAEDEAAAEASEQLREDGDPERMQAEVDAKRLILYIHSVPEFGSPDRHLCWDSMTSPEECETLQSLAVVYARHPDYQEAWKPDEGLRAAVLSGRA